MSARAPHGCFFARVSTRRERGVALIGVLWAVVVIGSASALAATDASFDQDITRNRIDLTRARWAAEACDVIGRERGAQDRVDLGNGVSCSVSTEGFGSRLNVNLATSQMLHALIAQASPSGSVTDSVVTAILRARSRRGGIHSVAELTALVDGMPSIAALLLQAATVDGPLVVDPSSAPLTVIATLPGVDEEFLAEVESRRRLHQSVDVAQILGTLPHEDRIRFDVTYEAFRALTAVDSSQLSMRAVGSVDGMPTPVQIESIVRRVDSRLVTVRRRMW